MAYINLRKDNKNESIRQFYRIDFEKREKIADS